MRYDSCAGATAKTALENPALSYCHDFLRTVLAFNYSRKISTAESFRFAAHVASADGFSSVGRSEGDAKRTLMKSAVVENSG